MPDAQVTIDPSMAHHFRLETWNALDDGGKLALGDYLSERLQSHGWDVPEPMALRPFGPPGELKSVLQWREPTSGMTFSFIPGGTFRPGFDEAQLDRLAEWRLEDLRTLARMTSDERRGYGDGGEDYEDEDEEEIEEVPSEYRSGRSQAFCYGDQPCDLILKPSVEVPTFFMATELIQTVTPGLRSILKDPKKFRYTDPHNQYPWIGKALHLKWDKVGPVLAHYGWALPTSAEFEWALRGGGVRSMFYWGDDQPEFWAMEFIHPRPGGHKAAFDKLMSADFRPDRPRDWPWCNRFGLAAMVAVRTWCAPSAVPGDPAPILARAGAATCYPWQIGNDAGEWETLLNAVEHRV